MENNTTIWKNIDKVILSEVFTFCHTKFFTLDKYVFQFSPYIYIYIYIIYNTFFVSFTRGVSSEGIVFYIIKQI